MHTLRSLLLLAGTISLMNAALAESALTPHEAVYKVRISVVSGQLRTQLSYNEGHYVATHTIRPTGMSRIFASGQIRESSEFLAAEDGIRPSKYQSENTIGSDEERIDIGFDWNTGEARGTVNDAPVTSVMDDIAHDRVSIQYELMHDLLNGEPDSEYILFDVDRLKTINVRNIGRKALKVPAGRFEAIGIQHQAENSRRVTTLWCVAELDYLPVVIEQHRKGKLRVRAVLTEYVPTDD